MKERRTEISSTVMELPAGDASTRILADVQMDGVFYVRSFPRPPFRHVLDSGNYAYCFMVKRGRLALSVEFPQQQLLELGPGDVTSLSGLSSHVFRSVPPPKRSEAVPFTKVDMGEQPQNDAPVELIIGIVPNETLALSSLILGPMAIRRNQDAAISRRIWLAADQLEEEFSSPHPFIGQALIVRRIAEIMLLNISRWIVLNGGTGAFSIMRAPRNLRILHALNQFVRDPYADWTVMDLAKQAGMSRTKFAEEFRDVTGGTPINTITRIRLTLIAQRMRKEKTSVEEAADLAGYGSAAAFVRAFQRQFGETPARWRKRFDGSSALGE